MHSIAQALREAAGRVPNLSSSQPIDLIEAYLAPKAGLAYEPLVHNRLHFVSPSQWLAAEARRSGLLNSAPVTVDS